MREADAELADDAADAKRVFDDVDRRHASAEHIRDMQEDHGDMGMEGLRKISV